MEGVALASALSAISRTSLRDLNQMAEELVLVSNEG